MGRGNIFLPIRESLKPCSWHSPLCSDKADFSRIWRMSLNLGFKELLKALAAVAGSAAASDWRGSLSYVWFSWMLREQGRREKRSLTFLMRQNENTLHAPGTFLFHEKKL